MNHPNELSYSKSHEWIKMDGDTAIIGISDFAQDALGDVVFVNLPAEGDDVTAAEAFSCLNREWLDAEFLSVDGVCCGTFHTMFDHNDLCIL